MHTLGVTLWGNGNESTDAERDGDGFYKAIIVGVLLWWLSHQRERLARYVLYIATMVYGAVCLWHAIGIWMMMS